MLPEPGNLKPRDFLNRCKSFFISHLGSRGIALIAVVLVMLFMGGLGIVVSNITQNKQVAGARSLNLTQAFYTAQAGVEWAIQYLASEDKNSLDGISKSFGGGTFTISYNTGTDELIVTGTVGNQVRKVKFSCVGASFFGSGDATCSTTGFGLIQSYGMAAGGIITDSTSGSLPTEQKQNLTPAPDSLSAISFPTYPAGTYVSRIVNGTTETLTAGTYLFDDFTIKGSGQVTLQGPATVYVNDTFTMVNSGKLTVDGTNGDVTIVVKQAIDFKNSSSLTTSQGKFDLLGKSDFSMENTSALTVGNKSSVQVTGELKIKDDTSVVINSGNSLLLRGDSKVTIENNAEVNSATGETANDLLILSNGDIKVENNTDMKAALYTPLGDIKIENNINIVGAMVAGGDIEAENSSTLTYDPNAGIDVLTDQGLCSAGSAFPACSET